MLTNKMVGLLGLFRAQLSLVSLYNKVDAPAFEALRKINEEITEAIKLLKYED